MSKTKTLGRNLRFVVFNRIISIVISFFLFPFIVRSTGKEIYGIYLIIMTVTGYFGLLDFGVLNALTKYVSEYNGKKDYVNMYKIINASFSFYVLIGIVVSILLFLCSRYLNMIFKLDAANLTIGKELFVMASISSLFIWPLNAFRWTAQGLNLWNIDATVNVITQILNAAVAYFIFTHHYGIAKFFIATQALAIIGNIIMYFVVRKRITLKLVFPYLHFYVFKFIFNFSFFAFLSSLVGILIFQAHNIIIGYFISLSAVSVYAVAYNIQNYFRTINGTIGGPPWVIASEMEGRNDYEGQKTLLFKGTKYYSAVFSPLVLIMLFFTGPFIKYWMGPGFDEGILPAKIIILFWLFNGAVEMAGGMLSAKGMIKKIFFIQFSLAITNIFIGIALIKILGITAMAFALTLSMVCVSVPLTLRLSLNSLNVSFNEYFNKSIRCNISLYVFVMAFSFIVVKYFYPKNIYFVLLEMGIIYFSSILLYYRIALKNNDRSDLRRLIGFNPI